MSVLPGLVWTATIVVLLALTISRREIALVLPSSARSACKRILIRWRRFSCTDRLAFGLAILGILFALWPRIMVDFSDLYDAESPFPASVTISNQFLPLDDVSLFIRPCTLRSDSGFSFIGSSDCTRGNVGAGGVTTPDWQKRYHLQSDDKWTIPLGRNVRFFATVTSGDTLIVVTYWPWPLPRPWFVRPWEYISRFALYRQFDGKLIWVRRPLDN
jgi:hypothetical protein